MWGARPAGIYEADTLAKSNVPVTIDVLEYLPAPYGLVRYGVAPDHPRIKEIVNALKAVLTRPSIRLIGYVRYGTDMIPSMKYRSILRHTVMDLGGGLRRIHLPMRRAKSESTAHASNTVCARHHLPRPLRHRYLRGGALNSV